jgi:hypothetical protein
MNDFVISRDNQEDIDLISARIQKIPLQFVQEPWMINKQFKQLLLSYRIVVRINQMRFKLGRPDELEIKRRLDTGVDTNSTHMAKTSQFDPFVYLLCSNHPDYGWIDEISKSCDSNCQSLGASARARGRGYNNNTSEFINKDRTRSHNPFFHKSDYIKARFSCLDTEKLWEEVKPYEMRRQDREKPVESEQKAKHVSGNDNGEEDDDEWNKNNGYGLGLFSPIMTTNEYNHYIHGVADFTLMFKGWVIRDHRCEPMIEVSSMQNIHFPQLDEGSPQRHEYGDCRQ